MEIFVEMSVIILLVTGVSILMKLLRQPFIVGYILTGILVGPYALNLLHSKDSIEFFSRIGITMLLFIVGLGLNPKVLREVGKISLVTGLGQVIFTSVVGYGICRFLGVDHLASIYIAIALTFSSTIIVLKLLTDKGDLESLYGKISVGLLLVQDLVASIILIMVSSLAGTTGSNLPLVLILLVLKGVGAVSILWLINKVVLPRVLKYIAESQELLFLFSLAWGMILASLFHILGFSVEIGALAAGVTLSSTLFATEIGSRMKPLRDFFVLLFFILLGSQMSLDSIGLVLGPAIVLSLFVLVGKPIIMIILMNWLGYRRRTGFFAGLTIAQISEFSLILVTLGVAVGHISDGVLSLITLVGLFTIAGSTYLIRFSDNMYIWSEKFIKFLELRKNKNEKTISTSALPEVILFGYDRAGSDFVKAIQKLNKKFVVVDYNPVVINRLIKNGLPNAYGDADDVEFLDELGISQAKLIVSTIPSFESNKLLMQKLHTSNPKALSIIISHHIADTMELYELGASYVIMPLYLGAQYAAHMIEKHGLDAKSFTEERERHLLHLSQRDGVS